MYGSRRTTRGPRRIGEILPNLLARHGYAGERAADQWGRVWEEAVGTQLARDCRVAGVRSGVLQVTVRSSAVVQELTFKKKEIMERLVKKVEGKEICDIRYRVGAVD